MNIINRKLKFIYCKNKFLTPTLCRILCNAIIQPHFYYACSAWYPNLDENLKRKIQIAQNKCIRSCLKLDKKHYVQSKEFESINWLPVYKRVHQCRSAITFKFVNNACPHYLNEVYEYASQCRKNQEITLPSPRFLFEILTWTRKTFNTLVPLYGTIYSDI